MQNTRAKYRKHAAGTQAKNADTLAKNTKQLKF